MSGEKLTETIIRHTEYFFDNAEIMLKTCNMEYVLGGFPIWKHAYHMLHSCDRWFINPNRYIEPDFHEPDMNSLTVMTETVLSREDLLKYCANIREKIMGYLNSLTDEMLYEFPPDCDVNRLSLIMAQYRHFYAHLGYINATTVIGEGKYPLVIGRKNESGRLYER